MEQEIWKDIKGYEGLYQVSSYGRIKRLAGKNCRKDRIRKPSVGRYGYLSVILFKNNKARTLLVSRIVCEAWHGPCPEGMECAHEDGNPANNTPDNLTWKTHKANCEDRVRHGTEKYGEEHPRAKLSDAQVNEIQERYVPYCKINGGRVLAREFDVARETIQKIVTTNYR